MIFTIDLAHVDFVLLTYLYTMEFFLSSKTL
jgi:hypothetical protein